MKSTGAVSLAAVLFLASCNGISEMDVPVYQREAAMIKLAQGNPKAASEMLFASLQALDTVRVPSDPAVWKDAAAEWTKASLTDARALEYRPADYELILMLTMRTIADIGLGGGDLGDLFQVQERQNEILAAYDGYDVPDDQKVTPENYDLVSFPFYLYAALEESNVQGGGERAKQAYQEVINIQKRQNHACPLAQEMIQRLDSGKRFPEGGAVHVIGFLGRGPKKVEKTDILPAAALTAVMVIISAWGIGEVGGADFSVIPVPFPDLETRPRTVAGFQVGGPSGATNSSVVTDVTKVAKSQFEATKAWLYAQALIPRIVKSITMKVGETAALQASSDYRAKLAMKVGFFITKLLWERSERADTRCWTTLPDTIQAARVDLPAGKHTLNLSALDGAKNAFSTRDVEVQVDKGKNTFVFVFFNSLNSEPSILTGQNSL